MNSPLSHDKAQFDFKKPRGTRISENYVDKSDNLRRTAGDKIEGRKRHSLNQDGQIKLKIAETQNNDLKGGTERISKNFSSFTKEDNRNGPLIVSKFEDGLKENLNRNNSLQKFFSSEKANKFLKNQKNFEKSQEKSKDELRNSSSNINQGKNEHKKNLNPKKAEFFLQNIINRMNNKGLRKCSKRKEEGKNTGKENNEGFSLEEKIERTKTRIYQYILDH